MKYTKLYQYIALTYLLFTSFCFQAQAQEYSLDWSDYGNTRLQGDYSSGYSYTFVNVDESGVDMTVTVESGQGTDIFQQTPIVNQTTNGGYEGEQSLYLKIKDYTADDFMDITVSFTDTSTGDIALVNNVSFEIFDLDYYDPGNRYRQDRVRDIYALDEISGSSDYLASDSISDLGEHVELTEDLGRAVLVGVEQVPDYTDRGNATVSYGDTSLSEFGFKFDSGLDFSEPITTRSTSIGIYDISFDVIQAPAVPEANTLYSLLVITLVGFFFRLRKRATQKS